MEQQMAMEAKGTIPATHHYAPLTSSEIACLWRTNNYYTMLRCVIKHFYHTTEDTMLRPRLGEVIAMFDTRVRQTADILRREGQPSPIGFGDEDVDLAAPRLFTDLYYFFYTLNMNRNGIMLGGMNLAHSVRKDVVDYYAESLISSARYYQQFSEIMLEKGIFIRPPVADFSKEVDVVKKQHFLRGFLGERRPLLAQEIEQLFFGIRRNQIGGALVSGFQQVARSEQVRAYMARGAKIANKHIEIFSTALQKENLPVPMHSGDLVTDSTISPFSDRLMMQHVVILNAVGLGNYANAMSTSPRHDLAVNYARLIGEVANYSEDGINIVIENGWYEEPPRLIDRREITRETVH